MQSEDPCLANAATTCLSFRDIPLRDFTALLVVLLAVFGVFVLAAKTRGRPVLWSFAVDSYRHQVPNLVEVRVASHLVTFVEPIFYALQWLSAATWRFGTRAASHNCEALKKEEPERGKFVEFTVGIWVVLCVVALSLAYEPRLPFVRDVICVLALVRIGDIFQAHVNAHLWDVLRVKDPKTERVRSLQRSLLLAAINYLELIGWFSAIYATFGLIKKAESLWDYLYFGAITQLTIGYGDLQPICAGKILAPLQTMLGTMLLVVGVARLVAAIRPPTAEEDQK